MFEDCVPEGLQFSGGMSHERHSSRHPESSYRSRDDALEGTSRDFMPPRESRESSERRSSTSHRQHDMHIQRTSDYEAQRRTNCHHAEKHSSTRIASREKRKTHRDHRVNPIDQSTRERRGTSKSGCGTTSGRRSERPIDRSRISRMLEMTSIDIVNRTLENLDQFKNFLCDFDGDYIDLLLKLFSKLQSDGPKRPTQTVLTIILESNIHRQINEFILKFKGKPEEECRQLPTHLKNCLKMLKTMLAVVPELALQKV